MQHSIRRVLVYMWTLKYTLRAHVQRVFPWSMRREAMQALGALGVLDPFVHKNIQKTAFENSKKERPKNSNKHADVDAKVEHRYQAFKQVNSYLQHND